MADLQINQALPPQVEGEQAICGCLIKTLCSLKAQHSKPMGVLACQESLSGCFQNTLPLRGVAC